jgi:hypothetical protein
MAEVFKDEGRKWEKQSHPTGETPVVCPSCGGKDISSCPGGSKLKAVPGIWWSCHGCHHEW